MHLQTELGKETKPPCYYGPCEWGYSELAYPELDPWLAIYRLLKSDTISANGLGRDFLIQAEAMTPDVLDLILALDSAVNEWKEAERERRKSSR